MALTLPEKTYLLTYDVQREKLTNGRFRGQLVRAAALIELTIGGQLTDRDGKAAGTSANPPADPLLATVLAELGPDQARSWRRLVDHRPRAAEHAVRGSLTDKGIVTVREGKVLGLLPRFDVIPADPAKIATLQQAARAAVAPETPVEKVPVEDAALAVLAAAGEVTTVFSRMERRRHKERLQQLGARLGGVAPALHRAIQAVRAARAAAASGGS